MTSASDLSFVDVDGNSIRYCMGAVGTCPGVTGELIRFSQPLIWQPLATGISGLAFSYLANDGKTTTATPATVYYVGVALTATQGTISKNYQIMVSPRNFP